MWRLFWLAVSWQLLAGLASAAISVPFFADLERLSRLVDISYCIGNTGVHKPFQCVSRCKDFPALSLVNTWSTGVLMGDSCGYIAVDHTGGGGLTRRKHDGADEAAGLETRKGRGSIIVAFRGTYSITNTIVDLSTVPQKYVPYPSPDDGSKMPREPPRHRCDNCTVHMGFLDSWRNARRVVLPELQKLRAEYPSYSIQLVGHSLGGAVACLAALELKVSLGFDGVSVTTFGEPRVGNYQLARFVDDVFGLDGDNDEALEARPYRRVTHANDPVPLLPLEEWGYHPHGGEVYITKPNLTPSESDIRTCVGDSDPACSAGAESASLVKTVRRLLHFSRVGAGTIRAHLETLSFPARFRLWELFFAHRDYFWRLGLCVPGGDPANWGKGWAAPDPDQEPGEL
ncbi:triacylglycerol lipase FGL2 [Purpureocillium lilacinum]|uniref:Triacylglycerol lipase FGL2 n=1 Tax=Purpureocillium lilacinum TaxID=33203 RepID=A0A179HME6_PURLI|nr:triacylglycerol lipase FGL2 [Purpureocillium lilacinum]OAQ91596.1 triacylglycerol lipase FGL2 [Purpureocillium lilacinum]